METTFWKMHGARNDFVLVDDRRGIFPLENREWIRRLCDRHVGIGCEGILLIQLARRPGAHLRMRFINPDGSEVDMCGNGARCIARLAYDLRIAPRKMRIETRAGTLGAEVLDGGIEVELTPPRGWRMGQSLRTGDRTVEYHYVDTGVPHAVLMVRGLSHVDVVGLGREIRRHPEFAPAGVNVDFAAVVGSELHVRTYERGVEAETPACGTGITAAALVAARLGLVTSPVTVVSAGGDRLKVVFEVSGESFSRVRLSGPAEYVFKGIVELPVQQEKGDRH
ncbi:MAG TPA: diaminopimelate epimerase [Kiritimatiellae bacterium]|nr:diaminopimelate epimerase [Kiritimatiellia bacterium]